MERETKATLHKLAVGRERIELPIVGCDPTVITISPTALINSQSDKHAGRRNVNAGASGEGEGRSEERMTAYRRHKFRPLDRSLQKRSWRRYCRWHDAWKAYDTEYYLEPYWLCGSVGIAANGPLIPGTAPRPKGRGRYPAGFV